LIDWKRDKTSPMSRRPNQSTGRRSRWRTTFEAMPKLSELLAASSTNARSVSAATSTSTSSAKPTARTTSRSASIAGRALSMAICR
jgi:hypothetical protein